MDLYKGDAMNYFEQSIRDYKYGSNRVQQFLPEVVQCYHEFTEACFAEGKISQMQKQLTALAISIYAQDEYCIIYHTKLSMELGATEEELMETIAVSAALGGGSAFSEGVTLALDTFDYYNQEMH